MSRNPDPISVGSRSALEGRCDVASLTSGSAWRRRVLMAAISLAVLACGAFFVDLPVARWAKTRPLPGELRRLLDFAEVFAHGTGVAVILLAAVVLDRSLVRGAPPADHRRRQGFLGPRPSADLYRMIAAAAAGGLLVDLIKLLVDRVRPRAADLTLIPTAMATFEASSTAIVASPSDLNSFPSGHAATAAGLAAALSWKYPRGTWLFVGLAIAAAAQRVAASAHYPSDILLGAACGLAAATAFLSEAPQCRPPPT